MGYLEVKTVLKIYTSVVCIILKQISQHNFVCTKSFLNRLKYVLYSFYRVFSKIFTLFSSHFSRLFSALKSQIHWQYTLYIKCYLRLMSRTNVKRVRIVLLPYLDSCARTRVSVVRIAHVTNFPRHRFAVVRLQRKRPRESRTRLGLNSKFMRSGHGGRAARARLSPETRRDNGRALRFGPLTFSSRAPRPR